jgi:putative endonuclease
MPLKKPSKFLNKIAKIKKVKSYRFGIIAEMVVIFYLRLKLYKIIAKRYKTQFGEVDIIAIKHQSLIAIEVKARKNKRSYLKNIEILTPKQSLRIRQGINYFLSTNSNYQNFTVRFDLIVVDKFFTIQHYKNYW